MACRQHLREGGEGSSMSVAANAGLGSQPAEVMLAAGARAQRVGKGRRGVGRSGVARRWGLRPPVRAQRLLQVASARQPQPVPLAPGPLARRLPAPSQAS